MTPLILLFLFTMALPATLLLLVSINLAGNQDLQTEEKIAEEFDRLGEAFVSELMKATDQVLQPYLQKDWSSLMDSENLFEEFGADPHSVPFLFADDSTLVFPLMGESPKTAVSDMAESPRSWREALENARALSESGERGSALEELKNLRNFPLQAAQRAELLLEEASILARDGRKGEAWERLERIVRNFPEARSSGGVPLALAALEGQVELTPADKEAESFIRMAEALYTGAYYPSETTENFLWERLFNQSANASIEVRDRIRALRNHRAILLRRGAELEEQFPALVSEMPPTKSYNLRVVPTSFSMEPTQTGHSIELIHRAQVENRLLWSIWRIDSALLWEAIDKAMEEVERFHASAYLKIQSPFGQELSNRPVVAGQPVPQPDRAINLPSPWIGWQLMMGLEHIGLVRRRIAQEREDSLKLAGLSAIVLFFGAFLVFRGIRRQLQVTRAKSDFVSAVSHELRTPIANIRMYGEMLQMGVPATDTDRSEAYRAITSETERLSRLIEGVLNYSRIQQGAKVFRVEEIDAHELVREVIDRTRQGLAEEFEFHLVTKGDPRMVRADPDALSQALENLLTNAVKYSPSRNSATVEIHFGARKTEISVIDRGIGLSRRDRKRIFERFHRVEDELTRKTSGTGLGLTLARDLVRGFGGKIQVKSKLGEGSRFTIVLTSGGKI
ncbi:MAG: hypothetical protein KC940_22185 [Candidatus Omnitrophica bacterium]|nr:hypothetical protein [Candidatus Omnitrophota bacterium]